MSRRRRRRRTTGCRPVCDQHIAAGHLDRDLRQPRRRTRRRHADSRESRRHDAVGEAAQQRHRTGPGDQLPQTLTFRDHNNAEKTGRLPNQLSTEGAPEGHDPSAGDIGYFSPGGDLVFYYDDAAPYFNGIVRIGEIDGNVDAIRQQDGDVRITIERAD
jgi:hypothetical protein